MRKTALGPPEEEKALDPLEEPFAEGKRARITGKEVVLLRPVRGSLSVPCE